MSKRYIKIARKLFESPKWAEERVFSEQEACLDLIFLAAFAEREINLGKEGLLLIKRGEIYYPQRQLAKRWGWGLSKLQRHLKKLSEGGWPSIEIIKRGSHFGSASGSDVGSEQTLIKLCNYDSYNGAYEESGSHFGSASESQNESLKNKGNTRIKGDKNTHTQYSLVKDLFVRTAKRANESADMCVQACKACEEMLLLCGADEEANTEHRKICERDIVFRIMVQIYQYYPLLQQSFATPLLPDQVGHLLSRYELADIWRILEAIANKRDCIKHNRSLFSTINQWMSTDIVRANRFQQQHQKNYN